MVGAQPAESKSPALDAPQGMTGLVKKAAAAVLGDYALYQVWQSSPAALLPVPPGVKLREVTAAELEDSVAKEFRDSAWYCGDQAVAYGAFLNGQMVALACCWWGARYYKRHSWPLPQGAAKLVHIVTLPTARGMGLAPLLIQHARADLASRGLAPVLARIWHSNAPSKSAFKRAGWKPVGWLILLNPLRKRKGWRITWRR